MTKEIKTCEINVTLDVCFDTICPCGKQAKFITPKDKMNKRRKYVCGIHRRSIDKMYERTGRDLRCQRLNGVK